MEPMRLCRREERLSLVLFDLDAMCSSACSRIRTPHAVFALDKLASISSYEIAAAVGCRQGGAHTQSG